jgi:hypothetical protein
MISRYAPLFFGLILGIAVGLVYGWIIRPAELAESSPETLREDYRIDITLMVAEAYAYDDNLEKARTRLTLLDPQDPEEQIRVAWHYAQEHDFSRIQISTLERLADDLGIEGLIESLEQP